MSELSVGTLSGLAANGYVIDVASGSTLDLSNGTNLPASALPAGSILQVVSAARTSPFTTASTTLTDVTDLSVSITPASTANDVLVLVNVSAVLNGATTQFGQLTVTDGSDNIILGAASPGSRSVAFSQAYNSSAQTGVGDMSTYSFMLLHSPATTSAFTYKVRAKVSGGTMYVNRNVDDSDAVARMRGVSTITVMEVAG